MDANQDMIDHVIAFDRSLRTVNVGSCAPFPVSRLMNILQERLRGKTITTEVTSDDHLITGLKNHTYQIAILHQNLNDKDLFCLRFFQENLYVSLPEGHPLTKRKSVSLDDLRGIRILMDGSVGFWNDIVLTKLSKADLLIQNSFEALDELVEASSLPVFHSDLFLSQGYVPEGRKSIPISDPNAHVTYWITTLTAEQHAYQSVFSAVRGNVLKNQGH